MFGRPILAAIALLFVSAAASAQTSAAGAKGYELYSWKIKRNWHYALVPGTNHAKSYEEITAKNLERVGTDALEAELMKIPRGEEVFWKGDAPPGAKRSESSKGIDLKHPSRKRIERIKAICDKLGIKLKLA